MKEQHAEAHTYTQDPQGNVWFKKLDGSWHYMTERCFEENGKWYKDPMKVITLHEKHMPMAITIETLGPFETLQDAMMSKPSDITIVPGKCLFHKTRIVTTQDWEWNFILDTKHTACFWICSKFNLKVYPADNTFQAWICKMTDDKGIEYESGKFASDWEAMSLGPEELYKNKSKDIRQDLLMAENVFKR